MMTENDEILFSQLADGELPSDQANELLLRVLDEPPGREKLGEILRLRQATTGWRTRQPLRPVMVVAAPPRAIHRRRTSWRIGSLAVAACIGGLLVVAGFWLTGLMSGPFQPSEKRRTTMAAVRVTPEQMQEVAEVFALHESVAGPLAWYAADDQNIWLASARGAATGQSPIAVLLRLESDVPGSVARTLVIVCREDARAIIELPAESSDRAGLRVYLSPRTINGKVEIQYAIAVDGQSQQAPLASLSGQRRLGLSEARLGQLAMGDKLLNIEAAAWPIRQERN